MSRRTIILLAIVALAAMALAACGGGSSSSGGNALNLTVTATEFKFDPNTLNAAPGQTVNITLKNAGSVDHTFVVPAVNFKMTVAPGKTDTKSFTAPTAPGTYPFDCDIAGHKEAGMFGNLIVK